ncbi:MAG: transglutaminase family protein [Ruminococcus sp.]|nr:transglutaminase family protein [Ruminococcus sp.]
MKRVRFEYITSLKLSSPVTGHYFSIRCIPQSTTRQRIESLDFTLYPQTPTWKNVDGFGNEIISGSYTFPHLNFVFAICGTALTDCTAIDKTGMLDCYRYPSKLTEPGGEIRAFYNAIKEDLGKRPYERSMTAMERLYDVFEYKQGITNVKTTAEQAFTQRCGVCQDYAHILLSILRLDGIPCRYAAGLFAGEGETHGWIEIYDGGWIGIDPTNCHRVNDEYIRISHGRDFADSAIDRGVIYGGGYQTQTVSGFLV